MAVTVHLVRHGEVENPKGVLYGRLPGFHLSERGRHQAANVAQHLADADIATIHTSPMERARETAAILAEPHGLEVTVDERLIESGTTLEGMGRTALAFVTAPQRWWSLRNPWRPSWGESFADIRKRMLAAIADATGGAEGREVVLVSHQAPVVVARLGLTGRGVPPWLSFMRCELASVSSLLVDDGEVLSEKYYAPPSTT